jgi:hypothetical protein
LAVYLHDPANAAAIVEANPSSVPGLGVVGPAKGKTLKKRVKRDAPGRAAVDDLVVPPHRPDRKRRLPRAGGRPLHADPPRGRLRKTRRVFTCS